MIRALRHPRIPEHIVRTLASSAGPLGGHLSPQAIGGKAANLVRLESAGLPVPPWFCVTTRGLSGRRGGGAGGHRRATSHVRRRAIAAQAAAYQRPGHRGHPRHGPARHDRAALHECFRELTASRRSSPYDPLSPDEDSAAASFAGQMDSYLFVPNGWLERRVLDCFASCFSPRALAYRSIHGRAPVRDAGVIVQRMIDSRVSGVLFTANPTTGDPTEIVVSAAIGVGEGVVADRAESDTFFVDSRHADAAPPRRCAEAFARRLRCRARRRARRSSTWPRRTRARARSDDAQVAGLARLGADVQSLFGLPQDVEWAFDARPIHVLQARRSRRCEPRAPDHLRQRQHRRELPGLLAAADLFVRARGLRADVPRRLTHASEFPSRSCARIMRSTPTWSPSSTARSTTTCSTGTCCSCSCPASKGRCRPGSRRSACRASRRRGRRPPHADRHGWCDAWRQLRVARRLIVALHPPRCARRGLPPRLRRRCSPSSRPSRSTRPTPTSWWRGTSSLVDRLLEPLRDLRRQRRLRAADATRCSGRLIARWSLGDPTLHNDLFAGGGVMESVRPVQSLLALARGIGEDAALRRPVRDDARPTRSGHGSREPRFADVRGRPAAALRGVWRPHLPGAEARNAAGGGRARADARAAAQLCGRTRRRPTRDDAGVVLAHRSNVGTPPKPRSRAGLSGHPIRRGIFSLVLGGAARMVAHREDMRLMRSRGFGMVKRHRPRARPAADARRPDRSSRTTSSICRSKR